MKTLFEQSMGMVQDDFFIKDDRLIITKWKVEDYTKLPNQYHRFYKVKLEEYGEQIFDLDCFFYHGYFPYGYTFKIIKMDYQEEEVIWKTTEKHKFMRGFARGRPDLIDFFESIDDQVYFPEDLKEDIISSLGKATGTE